MFVVANASTGAAAGSSGLSMIITLVLMFAVMYFLMIRPENKRKKKAQEMRDSIKKGDVVTTIGGIVAKVVQVRPSTVIVETSDDRVRLELTKWSISSVGVQVSETPNVEPAQKDDKSSNKKEETPSEEAASGSGEDTEKKS